MTKSIDELALRVSKRFGQETMDETSMAFCHALIAEYEADQGEAEYYEYRAFYADNTVTPGWGEWQRVVPRNALCTIDDAVGELEQYISAGYKYELRALYARPDPRVKELEAEVAILKTTPAHQRQDLHCVASDLCAQIRELERQLAETAKAMEFNFEQYQDACRLLNEECKKTETLTAQLAEALKALDRAQEEK